MLKKILSLAFIIILFITSISLFINKNKIFRVVEVISPLEFKLNNRDFIINDIETFDSYYSEHNSNLAEKLNITETEAFILGNLGKYWATNLMKGRNVFIKNENDIIYSKYSYRSKFLYSGFCIVDSKPYSNKAFNKKLSEIKRSRYKILDLDSEKIFEPDDKEVSSLQNFILIKKSHIPKEIKPKKPNTYIKIGDIKVYLTDLTTKYKPDNNCYSYMCKEILKNINHAQESIDIAIYGYSKVPILEKALKSAINRGVKIRLIYDVDNNNKNIYPDTESLLKLIPDNKSDFHSANVRNIMHNKFYIFDNETVITGSANLSHTDMSGFNSNSILIIKSKNLAKIYKSEFEQMYNGKFHLDKISNNQNKTYISDIKLKTYFSPQDKSIENAVLPIIRNAKQYIYIPTFVLTEKRVVEELIKAKNRGVDVKIIMDALNASIRHSKHKELRQNGIQVKTENYAGKMHSKSMIVDNKYTIIGSMNLSNSGENKNDENLILIESNEISKFYKEFFLYQWNQIDNKWLNYNARAEGKDSIGSCSDGIDNNYDGFTDLEDPACK